MSPAPRRRRSLASATAAALLLAGACGGDPTPWEAITPSPGAETYEGSIETPLDNRMHAIVTERDLDVVDSRLEFLPAGTAWADHLAFRDAHAGDLRRVESRLPEPDAPVLVAEYHGDDRTLLVIGLAEESRTRLVVLTTLTS